jgi:hypothetical protein
MPPEKTPEEKDPILKVLNRQAEHKGGQIPDDDSIPF